MSECMEESKSWYVVIESDLIMNKDISCQAKILYAIIVLHAQNKSGYCYLTYEQLANILNVSVRQIYRNVNELVKNNFVTIIKGKYRNYFKPIINTLIENREKLINLPLEQLEFNWLENED